METITIFSIQTVMSSQSKSSASGRDSSANSEPSTWGQLLLQYEMERTAKPSREATIAARPAIHRQEQSSFNPILGTYANPAEVLLFYYYFISLFKFLLYCTLGET